MTAHTPITLDWTVTKTTDPLRLQWAEAACLALGECDLQDAAAICAAFLDTTMTGGPRHDVYGLLYQDALWWADLAPPHELTAYVTAGLDRLPKSHLSTPRRKQVFRHLWRSFTDTERAAFLAHVKGGK